MLVSRSQDCININAATVIGHMTAYPKDKGERQEKASWGLVKGVGGGGGRGGGKERGVRGGGGQEGRC